MITQELKDRLESFNYDKLKEKEDFYLEEIPNDTTRAYGFSSYISRYAIYCYFVKEDIKEAKQYFYLSGKLTIYDIVLNNENIKILEEKIAFLLLSDNGELINKFATLRQATYNNDIKKFLNFIHSTQAVLREDWKHLEELNGYSRYNIENERGWKSYQGDLMFFEAFLEKNKEKMEEAILLMVKKYHKRRYDMPLFNEIISIPALTYAKLAYIKGYELDIDHPLIPKELLAINPNSEYWEYDFMKEGVYKDV
jgi:hypothetical protein